MTANAYFIAEGPDRFRPTELTGGAWRDDEQHLAPVVGLVVHHMEQWRARHLDGSLVLSRLSVDVLGKIAREEVHLATEAVRPGRTITLLETTATIAGRVTLRVRAWLLERSDTAAAEGDEFERIPGPESMPSFAPSEQWSGGYIASLTAWRAADHRPGRATGWLTTGTALIDGVQSSPLVELLGMVDVANGVAVRRSSDEWMFPNVDLTIHLFREPEGRLLGLDTRVAFGPNGLGVTSSVLHDTRGPFGTAQQSLTVRHHPVPA